MAKQVWAYPAAYRGFTCGEEIARGAFGSVHRATLDGRPVAAKLAYFVQTPPKSGVLKPEMREQLRDLKLELCALWDLSHEGLVNFRGVIVEQFCKENVAKYILMDLVEGGNLEDWVEENKLRDTVPFVLNFGIQISEVLAYIHRRGYFHRDIKPQNILVETGGHIRITDFGLAKFAGESTGTYCGTPAYMAPEIGAFSPTGYTSAVDVYSTGCVLMTMTLKRHVPGVHERRLQLLPEVARSLPPALSELPKLIEIMLNVNISERPSAHDVADTLRYLFVTLD